ncbi:MAG: HAD-IB family hydrolase [Pseudomonadales bacterium]|nr:HAD-IB family hydrolase [Pseudomonadales bacterium]
MSGRLALFDLDNTLLAGDSDHAWGEFVIEQGLVDAQSHRAANDGFYQQYLDGKLDIHAYVKFTLGPILVLDSEQRHELHQQFMQQMVEPMILESGRQLVQQHQEAGDYCVVITATNSFITAPIAEEFGVATLLATDLKVNGDRLTGEIEGVPCYQQGKVEKLQQRLANLDFNFALDDACFYTDSINDLPLMEAVGTPVAVDPDQRLADVATQKNWQVISLRS